MNCITLLALLAALNSFASSSFLANRLKCPPRSLKGGRVRIRSKGRVAKYVCLRGYQVLGDKYSTCVRGKWDTPIPICIKGGCLPLDVPHGQVLETYRGAFVTVHCDPGYSLVGTQSLYCNGAVWNDTAPSCREIKVNAQKWCDFENEDLCGWTHDLNHDFEWRRHNFATPSGHVGTGPSSDHTLGPGLNGHYMYLETSSPRLENDTARLFSPIFAATSNPNSCFIFWYHMFGPTTGVLKVYLQNQDSLLLFSQSGDHGDQWKEAIVSLPLLSTSFQVVIEGVRGIGHEGDIAIDDVKLAEGDECIVTSSTSSVPTSQDGVQASEWDQISSTVQDETISPAADGSINSVGGSIKLDYETTETDILSSDSSTSGIVEVSEKIPDKRHQLNSTPVTSAIFYTTTEKLRSTSANIINTSNSKHGITTKTYSENVTQSITTPLTTLNIFTTPSPMSNVTYSKNISIPNRFHNESSFFGLVTKKPTSSPSKRINTIKATKPIAFPTVFPSIKKFTVSKTSKHGFRAETNKPSGFPVTNSQIKPTIYFVTPPPPVVFRVPSKTSIPTSTPPPPVVFRVPSKTSIPTSTPPQPVVFRVPSKTSIPSSTPTSSLRQLFPVPDHFTEKAPIINKFQTKPLKVSTKGYSKLKNDVLHPFWERVEPTLPTTTRLKTYQRTDSKLVTHAYTSMPTVNHTSSNPLIASEKWKSKYKHRDQVPVHAQYAKPSSSTGILNIIVIVGGVLIILFTVLLVACVVRRHKINRSRSEDDELDIRFLASDEILDFTLARPSNYDSTQIHETAR